MKKTKKLSIGKLQQLLWTECKRLIRDIYALKTPQNAHQAWKCYTCDIVINSKQDAQTGHFIAKSVCGASLKYDLRNLRIQCMSCNVWKGGNGAVFYRNMVEREGQDFVDELFRIKNTVSIKAYDLFEKQLEEYKKL